MIKNRYRTDQWKEDSLKSIDLYNQWFMTSAPQAYREARAGVSKDVVSALRNLDYLREISSSILLRNPQYISVLRACTAPPLAIDRLVGLATSTRSVVSTLERGKLPMKMPETVLKSHIKKIISVIERLIDYELFPWITESKIPSAQSLNRSAGIVADRISRACADPIIRNSQEIRQLSAIDNYLESKGYRKLKSKDIQSVVSMPPMSYTHHHNVPVELNGKNINMPIDVVIQTQDSAKRDFPLLVECKSAGDFANTNKRRKEEALKVSQLRHTYGESKITFILFLCGYFDTTYLGYEASEGIDWVWEHRITDFAGFGI